VLIISEGRGKASSNQRRNLAIVKRRCDVKAQAGGSSTANRGLQERSTVLRKTEEKERNESGRVVAGEA